MTHVAAPGLLALHGVRILGGPSAAAIADRFGLRESDVRENLLDAEANGWVSRHDFFGETCSRPWASLAGRTADAGSTLLAGPPPLIEPAPR